MEKRLSILIFGLLTFISINISWAQTAPSRPASLSKEMSSLLDAVRLQRNGMATKDKYTLMDASELYRKVDVKSLSHSVTAKSSEKALQSPEILFSAAYCDALIEADFQPFDVAPITNVYMRPVSAPGLYASRISAGESATFSIRARKACQLMVVSNTGMPLEVSALAGGKEIPDMEMITEDNGSTNILLWWQPAGIPAIEVTIKNPGNEDVDFLLAAY